MSESRSCDSNKFGRQILIFGIRLAGSLALLCSKIHLANQVIHINAYQQVSKNVNEYPWPLTCGFLKWMHRSRTTSISSMTRPLSGKLEGSTNPEWEVAIPCGLPFRPTFLGKPFSPILAGYPFWLNLYGYLSWPNLSGYPFWPLLSGQTFLVILSGRSFKEI